MKRLCGFLVLFTCLLFSGLSHSYGKSAVGKGLEAGNAGQEAKPQNFQDSGEGMHFQDGEEGIFFQNPDNGYRVLVEDEAELLTKDQRLELSRIMEEITAYGNAAFVTRERNLGSAENLARNYYWEHFGTDSGTVFVIDMENRMLWIHSDGAVYQVMTEANADTVTDNVYRYASAGDYYGCACQAFSQILALLKGQRIARPMKYICNALLALALALLGNFGLASGFTRLKRPERDELLEHIHRRFSYRNLKAAHTHQTRIYDPVSRSGGGGHSGGGRSSGGSRGGGGGGRSGGGGGHGF